MEGKARKKESFDFVFIGSRKAIARLALKSSIRDKKKLRFRYRVSLTEKSDSYCKISIKILDKG